MSLWEKRIVQTKKTTIEQKYPNYNFTDLKTYDKSTNGIIYNSSNNNYYTTFHGINVKFDGSICKDYLDDNCYDIRISTGNLIYANYIFASDVDAGKLEQTGISYIIDRQGYLYETSFSLDSFGMSDSYSDAKVLKIGSQPNSDNKVFIFEDNSVLEFAATYMLDLNELYDR